MFIGRGILERGADAIGRRMLGHEVVETLHLALCASLYFYRNDFSVNDRLVAGTGTWV